MIGMFAGCSSLISLDLNNFDTSLTLDMAEMFSECSSLKSLNIANFNTSNVYTFYDMFYGCSSLQSLDLTKFIFMDDPDLEIENMFSGCNFNLTYCINDIKNPELSSLLSDFINDCLYICSKNPNKKFIIQDNICLDECTDYHYEFNKMCYEECPNGTKPSLTNEFLCEIRNDETQEIRNDETQEIRNDTSQECNIADAFNNNCKVNNTQENIVKNIKEDLKNGTLDTLILNLIGGDKKDLIITENNMVYQITTSDNQNNKEYYNISTIRLGECENILKIMHGIDLNETLLIFKIDYYPPGSLIPIINYEVLHPRTKEKLKLDYCNDEMINVNLPVSNDFDGNDLYKYDKNSDYYTDICFKHTTENGTDILLNDRFKEYNENNMALCENNCDLEKYDENSKQVTCECKVKINDLENPGLLDNTDSLYYNFTDNDLSSNMISMKCAYTLFSEEGMIVNIASYIFIIFILLFVVSGILFYKFGYPSLELLIKEIITKNQSKKNSNKTVEYQENDSNNKEIIKRDIRRKTTKKKKKKLKVKNIYNESNNQKQALFSNNTFISKAKLEINKDSPIIHKVKKLKIKAGNSLTKTKKKKNINDYNDFELNNLLYVDALAIDHRSYIDYYLSLIKTKHPVIMIFTKDYNTKIIKINLIFVSFSLQYLFNGLFFNESTIHQIYVDKGSYNISYLMKYIIISFIISHILTIVIKKFSLSEKNICNIKKQKNALNAFKASDEEKKTLTIKYICFYAISIGFFVFSWYYLSSFSAVYQNSQIHLIKNVLITFGISLIYPFIYNFLPAIFRINSLKDRQSKCLYKISEIIQLL
jgi:surface protein